MVEPPPESHAITMLYVDDVARSRDFFREVVGLELSLDAGAYAEFTWANLILGLRQRANAVRQYGGAVAPGGSGASHQITVTVDDVSAFADRLAARGADVIQPLTDQAWGMRSTSFRDPDGHVFEVCQPIG
ncbi:MAG TPA: VOC family protein [Acidimicrobiales bacterium]|nr:VOC family protein [Acidimicrobiales bacterium]